MWSFDHVKVPLIQTQLQKLLKEELPSFNRVLGDHNIALIVTGAGPDPDQRRGN